MIAKRKRSAWTTTSLQTWLLHLLCAALCVVSANADEIDTKINEIHDTLRKSRVEAVTKALKDLRAVAADLVTKGDPRKDQVLARADELASELTEPIDLDQIRKLTKEFEAIEGRGGWWWLQNGKNEPEEFTSIYRLENKRFVHKYKDQQTKQWKVDPQYSAGYEVIGVDPADKNIIVVRMTYPPKPDGPGDIGLLRFNRNTGVITSNFGFYGMPAR
jgi:hypothetical protein